MKKTTYQLEQERAGIFSQHFRALIKTGRFEDDTHGAHAEANRLTDLQMAGDQSTAPVASEHPRIGESISTSDNFSWDDVLSPKADADSRPAQQPPEHIARQEESFNWDEAFGHTARAADQKAPTNNPGAFDWDEAFAPPHKASLGTQKSPAGVSQSGADEFSWDDALPPKAGKPEAPPAQACKPDAFGWDEILDQHNNERKRHGF
jgi:hypothetical protein